MAGNARHIAIGSDLDGGFGAEQCPRDLETIADLQKLAALLRNRGYSSEDVSGVFHGNWLRFLRSNLPG
ncbi:MAG: membrane dipeptidase [Verrucomicrobia bacterium]|nr:membrane dipeptidase [Verrucomicrobiota bacterium]